MKKMILGLFAATFMILMASVLFAPGRQALAADTTAPVLDPNSITVKKAVVGLGEKNIISFKISDESDIGWASLWVTAGGIMDADSIGVYNKDTGLWDFEVSNRYFGLNEISSITLSDAYGNRKFIYNNASARVPDYFSGPEDEYANLSKGNFTVSTGSYAEEHDAPVVDFNSVTVSNPKPKLNEKIFFKLKISDSSPIGYTYISYAYANETLNAAGNYNPSSGYYEYEVDCTSYGKYEPIKLVVQDAFGNVINYADRNQSLFKSSYIYGDELEATLSAANASVEGVSGDTTPPKLDLNSFKITKLYVEREESTYLSFEASDNIGISCVDSDVWYGGEGGDAVACSFTYNKKTKRYEVQMEANFFGTHQIYELRLRDTSGNTVVYLDESCKQFKQYGFYPEEGYVSCDLSPTQFHIGLENAKTGTFVSNSTMDDTSELDVKELSENGDTFDKLLPDGYNPKGFYEVDIAGACNMNSEESKVCFEAPEGFEEGDIMVIQHLLSDGNVQTKYAPVQNGKVRIDVKEFSPFLISAKKSTDKNLFTRKGLTYQVTGKKTVKLVGVDKKNIKNLTIPATVKAFGKKYNVTEIYEKACFGLKKLKKVTLGKNIKKIGTAAFSGCKKLKSITIKASGLKSVGKKALAVINKKAVFTVPKKKLAKYKKLISSKTGFKKTMKIK